MIAYKLTNKSNESCVVDKTSLCIKYKQGEWTLPNVPKSGIFVFKSLRFARLFANRYNRLWKCEVPSMKPIKKVAHWIQAESMLEFWKNRRIYRCGRPAPDGSYIAPKVKLLEEIKLTK